MYMRTKTINNANLCVMKTQQIAVINRKLFFLNKNYKMLFFFYVFNTNIVVLFQIYLIKPLETDSLTYFSIPIPVSSVHHPDQQPLGQVELLLQLPAAGILQVGPQEG